MPHHDSEHSDYALMVRDRPPTTYLWQRAPTLLKVKLCQILAMDYELYVCAYFELMIELQGGEAACCFQRKHLDLILPYWMGRYSHAPMINYSTH